MFDGCVHFLCMKCNKNVEIIKSVQIDDNLKVSLYAGKKLITFTNILCNDTLSCWEELENILINVKK